MILGRTSQILTIGGKPRASGDDPQWDDYGRKYLT